MESLNTEKELLEKIYSVIDNKEFLTLFITHPLIHTLIYRLKNYPDENLDQIQEYVLDFMKEKSKDQILETIEFLYAVCVRENVLGRSIYTQYVEETKAPLIKGGPLPETEADPISNKNQSLQEKLLCHFEKDSEQIYLKT